MKKIISIFAAALIMCSTLAGCSSEKEAVATDGSTSMERLSAFLAKHSKMTQELQLHTTPQVQALVSKQLPQEPAI